LLHDPPVLHRVERELVHLHPLAGLLARHVEDEVHAEPVTVRVGPLRRRGVDRVVLAPPLALLANRLDAALLLADARHGRRCDAHALGVIELLDALVEFAFLAQRDELLADFETGPGLLLGAAATTSAIAPATHTPYKTNDPPGK